MGMEFCCLLEKCFSDFGWANEDEFALGPLRQERG